MNFSDGDQQEVLLASNLTSQGISRQQLINRYGLVPLEKIYSTENFSCAIRFFFFVVHVQFVATEYQAFITEFSLVSPAKVSSREQFRIGRIMCAFVELRAM